MNRLWIRLSLAFSGLILTGVIIIFALVMTSGGLQEVMRAGVASNLTVSGGFVDKITDAYTETQSWDDVGIIIDDLQQQYRNINIPIDFGLLSTDGNLIHSTDSDYPFSLSLQGDVTSISITTDDETIAYLQVRLIEPNRDLMLDLPEDAPLQSAIQREFQRALLLVTVLSAIVGIIAGTIISRYLTRPLGQLALVARAIRDKKTSQRVVLADTSMEINEVAHAFNEMLDALDHAEQLRRNLVADVAHELRTPLSVLQGNIYAILDDVYPANKEQVARLYDQTRVLSRLVSDLHELSQAEANQLHLRLAIMNIQLMIEERTAIFEPVALSKGITLTSDISSTLPPLKVDAERIEQVLSNLINNAIIHTSSGGQVTVRAYAQDDNVVIRVVDTGSGIPPDKLENIFERFYRVDPNRTRAKGGTGLGLAIVKAIVTIHGGTVTATSQGIGEGSQFTIKLPIHNPND